MPRYWTSSTIWYSGIFAAAATLDAGVKMQRREKWDMAIAEVKQELDHPGSVPLTQANAQTSKEVNSASNYVPFSDDEWQELEANADSSIGRRHRPQWPTNTGAPLKREHLPPQSIYATDWRKTTAESTRWGRKKLEKVSLSVDLMQLRMFLALRLSSEKMEEAANAVPDSYASYIRMPRDKLIRLIHSKTVDFDRLVRLDGKDVDNHGFERSPGDMLLSNYQQDDLGYYHDAARKMNRTLQDLFHRAHNDSRSTAALLGRVYFTIGASAAPPNIDTYNILLANLSHLREHRLVEDAIISLQRTQMRSNEVSLAAMLNHYTITSDAIRFRELVLRMLGRNGGLMAAKADIKVTQAGRPRLVKNERNGRTLQLPYPTPLVFGALVKGVLHFSGFEKALQICSIMSKNGWGLCMSGMSPLLQDCAQRGDWESGLAVWQRIQILKAKSHDRERYGWATEPIKPQTYVSMLRLCMRAKQRDVFSYVLDQIHKLGQVKYKEVISMLKSGEERMEDSDPVRAAVTDASAIEDEQSAAREKVLNVDSIPTPIARTGVEIDTYDPPVDQSAPRTPKTDSPSFAAVDHSPRPPERTSDLADRQDAHGTSPKRFATRVRPTGETANRRHDYPDLGAHRPQDQRTSLTA